MKRFRIGFIIHQDKKVPAWYAETIREILSKGHSIYFLLVRLPDQKKGSIIYELFNRFEKTWFRHEHDSHRDVQLQLPALVQSIPVSGFLVNNDDAVRLRAVDLDLIYSIHYEGGDENISGLAKFGLWHVRFGTGKFKNAKPPAFWEVMENSPVTGSCLIMHRDGTDYILYDGTTRSIPHSVKNNFDAVSWRAASYLGHRLNTLSGRYEDFHQVFPTISNSHSAPGPPGNAEMIKLFFKNYKAYLSYKKQLHQSGDKFRVLYSFDPVQKGFIPSFFHSLEMPPGFFYADPFIIKKEGSYFLFFEAFDDSKEKAHIAMVQHDGKQWSEPSVVLEKEYHLSYPFVFEKDGHYYMIPETSANRTVELYRAVSFPGQWEFVMNLFENTTLIDATVYYYNNRWWLFANSNNHPFASTNDQLFLFYNDELLSASWTPHPLNPIATHAGNCRPAGRIFEKNGKLYRPAQDNASQQYGYGLKINEINLLNEKEYMETEVESVAPEGFNLKAIHHLDMKDALTVIDGIKSNK